MPTASDLRAGLLDRRGPQTHGRSFPILRRVLTPSPAGSEPHYRRRRKHTTTRRDTEWRPSAAQSPPASGPFLLPYPKNKKGPKEGDRKSEVGSKASQAPGTRRRPLRRKGLTFQNTASSNPSSPPPHPRPSPPSLTGDARPGTSISNLHRPSNPSVAPGKRRNERGLTGTHHTIGPQGATKRPHLPSSAQHHHRSTITDTRSLGGNLFVGRIPPSFVKTTTEQR